MVEHQPHPGPSVPAWDRARYAAACAERETARHARGLAENERLLLAGRVTHLLRFVRSHGVACSANADHTLTLSLAHTDPALPGAVVYESVTIPATLKAARGALGY